MGSATETMTSPVFGWPYFSDTPNGQNWQAFAGPLISTRPGLQTKMESYRCNCNKSNLKNSRDMLFYLLEPLLSEKKQQKQSTACLEVTGKEFSACKCGTTKHWNTSALCEMDKFDPRPLVNGPAKGLQRISGPLHCQEGNDKLWPYILSWSFMTYT